MTAFKGKTLLAAGIALGLVAVGGVVAVYSGIYNIAADDSHTAPVRTVLETVRERSIAVRAARLQVPADLDDPARIRQGAGNYDAMCTGCHLAPGAGETELSKGLYPAPPNLSRQSVAADKAFWVIKHGIKASGMPAWGKSMEDEYIWNMAAFLQELPRLDRAQYTALVAGSGGHSHGGGETGGHSHAQGEDDHHEENGEGHHAPDQDEQGAAAATTDVEAVPATGKIHVHADGKTHVHAAETPAKPAAPTTDDPHAGMDMPQAPATQTAEDGHDHQQ